MWETSLRSLGSDGLLSVIMPAYHLGGSIAANVRSVITLLADNLPFEIVVVDDGSDDGTAEAIEALMLEYPIGTVVPVVLKQNAGKGNALRQGFKASRGSHVLLLDGDLDLSPETLPQFFDVMVERNADIVIGSKRHPQSHIDYPWHRRLASVVYYSLVWMLTGLPVSDTQTGMKLFKREALKSAIDRMLVKSFAFDVELLVIARSCGYAIAEAPIRMQFGNKLGCLRPKAVRQVMIDTLAVFYRLRILRYYRSVEPVEQMNPPPLVSVIIACPASSDYLRECLSGLSVQTYPRVEVIVLPDAGFAPEPEFVNLDLRIIPTGKIRPAEKRNRGAEAARGEILAFLDDDAYPIAAWLEHVVPYFSKPDVGGVGGPGVTPPGDPWLAQMGGRVYANYFVSGNYRFRYVSDRVRSSIDDYPSCNLAVRSSAFRAVGGFSTRYWPGEDTILCSDIVHKQNLRLVYDPWALVYHHRRALFLPHLRQIGRYALHRGYFAKRFPETSRRVSYMMPSLFVIGLAVGLPLSFCSVVLAHIYCAAVATYAVLTLLSTVHYKPHVWLVTWLGVVVTHLVYGMRFMMGLCAFRMPCEVMRFDHPAEVTVKTEPSTSPER